MSDQTGLAKRALERRGVPLPQTNEEIRQAAYELLKEEDFLAAHVCRLNKYYHDFTQDDWAEVLRLSGREKVEGNMAAFVACLSRGLLSP